MGRLRFPLPIVSKLHMRKKLRSAKSALTALPCALRGQGAVGSSAVAVRAKGETLLPQFVSGPFQRIYH